MHIKKSFLFGVWMFVNAACLFGLNACSDSSGGAEDNVIAPIIGGDSLEITPPDNIIIENGDTIISPIVPNDSGDILPKDSINPPAIEPTIPKDSVVPFVGNFPVTFSEISPSNANLKDAYGNDPPWIELFNNSNEAVDLKGISLTDNLLIPNQFTFDQVVLPAKSHLVVFMSGKNIPNYILPSDTVDLTSENCSAESNGFGFGGMGGFGGFGGQNSNQDVVNLPGQSSICFSENGEIHFGAVMKVSQNFMGGSNSSFGVNKSANLSKTNQLILKANVDGGHKIRLSLKGYDWGKNIRGTAAENTYYISIAEVAHKMTNVTGSTFTLETQGSETTTIKVSKFLARNRGDEPHASFKIKNQGSLYLVGSTGILDSVHYENLPLGTTWSKNEKWGIAEPTPYGNTLGEVFAVQTQLAETVAPPSGFYSSPITVQMPAGTRCESTGKLPTQNSALVTGPLTINATTVMRCITFKDGEYPSDVINRTYVFEQKPTLPVFFVTVDKDSMFDPQKGLYMKGDGASAAEPYKGANYWSNRELPVFVEMIEPQNSKPAFAYNVAYKIKGQYSRAKEKKSFSLTFREELGEKRLKYPLFTEAPELKKFKSFVLRNNGNNFGKDYIRDRLGSSMTEGLDLDYQRGRAAIVYYNGEYFGIHNIRESNDEYYYETHYGINPDDIDLIDASNNADAGFSEDYKSLMNWLNSNSLTSEANYNYVAEKIDIDNFINYMQTEMFLNNRDWPGNNMKKWRARSTNSKWKYFLYDLDYGFGTKFAEENGQIPLGNIFAFVTNASGMGWPNGAEHTLLLRKLLENENFKNSFINRFSVLLSTKFSESQLLKRIEVLQSEVQSEIPRDIQKWNLNSAEMDQELANIKASAKSRQSEILNEMQSHFNLGQMVSTTITVQGGGYILVNGLLLNESASINFFKGIPVTLTAVPITGVFSSWSDGITEKTRVINPGEIVNLAVNFK